MDNELIAVEISPQEEALFRIQRQVASWVSHLLSSTEPKKTQAALANEMGKQQPFINRIVAGRANLELSTIAGLEVALKNPILLTPPEFEHEVVYNNDYWNYLSRLRNWCRIEYGIDRQEVAKNYVEPQQTVQASVTQWVDLKQYPLPSQRQHILQGLQA